MIVKFFQLIKQLGLWNSFLYLGHRAGSHLYQDFRIVKYYFVAQPIATKKIAPPHRGKNIVVRPISQSESNKIPFPRPMSVIRDRYEQGATCLAAFIENKFAGYLWYIKESYLEDEVCCRFVLNSATAVWDFDVFVLPKFRLNPVFLRLWDEANEELRNANIEWTLSRISAFNPVSLSSHKRLGAKVIGSAIFSCIGSFQLTISTITPFINLSRGKQHGPTLVLSA